MKCPYCLVEFHDDSKSFSFGEDVDGRWEIIKRVCPSCKRMVLCLDNIKIQHMPGTMGPIFTKDSSLLIKPKTANRSPVPPEVPDDFISDYKEACMVLADSPKASAALSRRSLQHILRDRAGVKKGNLADEIQQVLDSGKLPSYLSNSLDAIRNIGNFAAHPTKSERSGEVVEVEAGEAEWNLDVIEALFDFYFVQPEIIERKRTKLNKKLTETGKPPMK